MLLVIRKLIRLSFKQYLNLVEAFFGLIISKLILFFYPFKKIAPRLGNINEVLNKNLNSIQEKDAYEIKLAVARVSRFVPWSSVCIDQAMTGHVMLSRRKIPSGLCLGVKKDNENSTLFAHAWVVCGNRLLIGGKESRGFKVVSTFVKNH